MFVSGVGGAVVAAAVVAGVSVEVRVRVRMLGAAGCGDALFRC